MRTRISIPIVGTVLCLLVLPALEGRSAESKTSSAAPVSPKQATDAAPAAATPAPAAGSTEQSVSMFPIEGDKPLSIRSDELEAIEDGGRRRLLFTRNVNIEQGDLRVHSDKLEALYPPGGNQPDKLVATGNVRVSQLDKTMLCDSATFHQTEDRLVCTGNAELQQGTDRVRGREIEIFVKQNRVKVRGGAVVNVAPKSGAATPTAKPATSKTKP